MPKVGIGTDQLVDCGCLLNDTGSLASASMGNGGQRIIIVNYVCPLGAQGIARVSVINGVADEVTF